MIGWPTLVVRGGGLHMGVGGIGGLKERRRRRKARRNGGGGGYQGVLNEKQGMRGVWRAQNNLEWALCAYQIKVVYTTQLVNA